MGSSQSSGISATLSGCLNNTGAHMIYPASSDYNATARAENVNYNYKPAAIAQPYDTDQVSAIVQCVAQDDGPTKLSTVGGGHGYAAYGLGGADGFVVINSANMATVDVDTTERLATVGMGMDLGKLAKAIGDQGFALPHGTCPTVGVSGHSMGGGWGFSSRRWGYLQDHIVSFTYVDPTGGVRQISNTSTDGDADIWWAMRGAGSNNFGVVTSFTYALETAPPTAVNFRWSFVNGPDCAKVMLTLQDLGLRAVDNGGLPAEFGGSITLYGDSGGNGESCAYAGQYLGDVTGFNSAGALLNDTLDAYGVSSYTTTAKEITGWVNALTDIMGNLTDSTWYLGYYAQSVMDDGSPGYTLASAQNVTAAVTAARGVEGVYPWIGFDVNGPVARTNLPNPYGDAALAEAGKRSALFISQIFAFGCPGFDKPDAQKAVWAKLDGIQAAVRAAKPGGGWNSYVNYIDPRLQNFGEEYYGSGLGRLKGIKAVVDPKTIFDFPQGLAHA